MTSGLFHRFPTTLVSALIMALAMSQFTEALPTQPSNQTEMDKSAILEAISQTWISMQTPVANNQRDCKLPEPSPIKPRVKVDPEYDFIVVGSGSAGAAVAGRLSERPDFKVLLIESGGMETILTQAPALWNFPPTTAHDEWYETLPVPNAAFGMEGRRSLWPRGNVLGGGSSINAMMYVRGPPADYDNWAQMGAEGWSWDEVLPFFKRSEGNRIFPNNRYHNTTGPLTIEYPRDPLPLAKSFLEAGVELGYAANFDYNGPLQKGFSYTQRTTRDGRRFSTSKAFLEPAAHRPNLHILTEAKVTKVLFDGKQAIGVEYDKGCNYTVKVRARKEVILSAGAIESPKLLLLSGVGPCEQLKNVDIPQVAELPGVGRNLHDHYTAPLHFLIDADEELIEKMNHRGALTPQSMHDLLCDGTGRLSNSQIEAFAFLESPFAEGQDWPDIEMYFWYTTTIRRSVKGGFIDALNREYFDEHEGEPRVVLEPLLQRPEVRGRLELASSKPSDKPVIYYPYYDSEKDMKIMVWALKKGMEIMKQDAFKKYNPRLFKEKIPGCERFNDTTSDEYLECYARVYTMTMIHYSGTAKMGNPANDPMAVVDPQLRVLGGIKGLRVCDASVMPQVTSADTMAPSIMIGERCADFIKHDY